MNETIYVIAQEELLPSGDTETRVLHNLGAFKSRDLAEITAFRFQEEEAKDAEASESEGEYYVLEMQVKG